MCILTDEAKRQKQKLPFKNLKFFFLKICKWCVVYNDYYTKYTVCKNGGKISLMELSTHSEIQSNRSFQPDTTKRKKKKDIK